MLLAFLCLTLLGLCSSQNPLVLLHGIGDACTNEGMNRTSSHFAKKLGVYTRCIEAGANTASWFETVDNQFSTACEILKADHQLVGKDIDIVALSQGNLIARGLIQKCDFGGRVRRYISIAGPH